MQYPSKLLLFGEHTINRGSDALAIPYPAFGGTWAHSHDHTRQQNLLALRQYLSHLQAEEKLLATFDLTRFQIELEQGLYFDSNIPIGYGLGSSGALCAAVYDRFCEHKIALTDSVQFATLKRILAQIESFFHGSSSGTDPLICYLQQPTLIFANGQIETVALPEMSRITFFLLDTGIPRSTEPLVKYFLNRCEDAAFLAKVKSHLVGQTNHAIAAFIKSEWKLLFENVTEISRFQIEAVPDMTPPVFQDLWKAGLKSDWYRLKMCGAGGGGFILGITLDWKKAQATFANYTLRKIEW